MSSSLRRSPKALPLKGRKPAAHRVWNRLRPDEVATVLAYAHRYPGRSSRELAYMLTDEARFSVSESTLYRILKQHGLVPPAVVQVAQAAKEYHRKTTAIHQLWQTDLTCFFVVGWGWYYVGGVLDDYSRYLLAYQVARDMTGPTLSDLVQQAVEVSGMTDVPVEHKVALLSDNGSGYLSKPFNEHLRLQAIRHLFAARLHPQTVGKFERLNRTAKSRLGLVLYASPDQLQAAVARFVHWYNHERYHEALGNVRPADVYEGRAEAMLARRKEVQRRTYEQRRRWNLRLRPQPTLARVELCE